MINRKGYQLVSAFLCVKLKTSNKLLTPEMRFCFEKLKPLSRLFSEIFDFSEKDGEMRFRSFCGACLDNTSISDYCEDHKAVSADTVLKLGRIPIDDMTGKCNRLLALCGKIGMRDGRFRGCDTGIDYHDVVYHGEKQETTIKTKKDGQIRTCHRYAVASLTGNKRFLALGIQPYRKGDGNLKTVDRLIDCTSSSHSLLLMDRFFIGIDVYDCAEKKGRHYLTPYKINDMTDEMYKQSLLDGETVKRYNVKNMGGEKDVYMYLVPHPEDEYHVYVSDLPDLHIEEHYPNRWNIENLFKIKNMVKPVTSTTSESFRLLLITIALILASLWKLLVRAKEHMTVKKFKKQLYRLLQELTLTDIIDDDSRAEASID